MGGNSRERLDDLLRQLPEEQIEQLLDYAEFLLERYGPVQQLSEPLPIPRPAQESVVRAIRRLAVSYPMLDRQVLFSETTSLVNQHVMQGRDAVEVIDELEQLFRRHYEALAAADGKD